MIPKLIAIWPLVAMALGLASALAIGLSHIRSSRLTTYAAAMGIVVNVAVQMPDLGPGFCPGMVCFPVLCILITHLGRGVRWMLVRLGWIGAPAEAPGPLCPQCGYCLVGLPERVCPECGRAFTLEELQHGRRARDRY